MTTWIETHFHSLQFSSTKRENTVLTDFPTSLSPGHMAVEEQPRSSRLSTFQLLHGWILRLVCPCQGDWWVYTICCFVGRDVMMVYVQFLVQYLPYRGCCYGVSIGSLIGFISLTSFPSNVSQTSWLADQAVFQTLFKIATFFSRISDPVFLFLGDFCGPSDLSVVTELGWDVGWFSFQLSSCGVLDVIYSGWHFQHIISNTLSSFTFTFPSLWWTLCSGVIMSSLYGRLGY